MRLDPYVRDYRGYMNEFVEALESPATRFYLDTSVLTWLIQLGDEAREEFMDWCQARSPNVRVPVWAAQELHVHVSNGTLRTNLQKMVREAQSKLKEFTRLATECADETICCAKGYTGRANYIGEVEQSLARFDLLVSILEPDDTHLQRASEAVITFVNEHVLSSDIEAIIEKLSKTGELRYSHFIPPGFHDKKDENCFGDPIIWEELIADMCEASLAPNNPPRNAVFISRDGKTDWVSGAPLVIDSLGAIRRSDRKRELDVILPHPLLVHEFRVRARSEHLYVTQPGFMASALHYAARKKGQPPSALTHSEGTGRRLSFTKISSAVLVQTKGLA